MSQDADRKLCWFIFDINSFCVAAKHSGEFVALLQLTTRVRFCTSPRSPESLFSLSLFFFFELIPSASS